MIRGNELLHMCDISYQPLLAVNDAGAMARYQMAAAKKGDYTE